MSCIDLKWDNFSRFCVNAGIIDDFDEPLELIMTKAFPRICAIDSRRWIEFLLGIFSKVDDTQIENLSQLEVRMLQMFQFTIQAFDQFDPNLIIEYKQKR